MNSTIFEDIKRRNEHGAEYWSGRELSSLLGYTEWRNFEGALVRAKESCKNSLQKVSDHFVDAADMIKIGSGSQREALREIGDYHMSRYACYLIAQNADPRKEAVAFAQTYFALQTRKQEIHEQRLEDSKRVTLRDEMKTNNKKLFQTARNAGVSNYGNFQDFGYMGLYGGLRQKDLHARKKLKPKEKPLDHMGSEELAANLFRATQTEAKLRRELISGEEKANKTHYAVGKKVRSTIRAFGGTMPEELPAAENIRVSQKRIRIG